MAIEVKVKPIIKTQIRQYPCLGQYKDGMIVLFTDIESGMVVNNSRSGALDTPVGYYSEDWCNEWEVFEGTVALSYNRDE